MRLSFFTRTLRINTSKKAFFEVSPSFFPVQGSKGFLSFRREKAKPFFFKERNIKMEAFLSNRDHEFEVLAPNRSHRFRILNDHVKILQKRNCKTAASKNSLRSKGLVSITYEEIGLFPRSFNRVFDRFFKQVFSDVDTLVIEEYRFYRYLFLTTVRCIFLLLFLPFCVNFAAKTYLLRPITEYYWNTKGTEIFLNAYSQKIAYEEYKEFEEKLYFESLLSPSVKETERFLPSRLTFNGIPQGETMDFARKPLLERTNLEKGRESSGVDSYGEAWVLESLSQKTMELALLYNEQSIDAITNFFADLLSFGTLCFLFLNFEIQMNITKSFLLEVFFGLDDSKKSLFILFITDLLVGYHSPNIWELLFQSFFFHYGIPENETTIFLLVATLPVLLDVLFKYLIFRHLNRASPATVATYHAMIE